MYFYQEVYTLTDPIDIGVIKSGIYFIQNKERRWLVTASARFFMSNSIRFYVYFNLLLLTFGQQTRGQGQQQSSLHQKGCPLDETL